MEDPIPLIPWESPNDKHKPRDLKVYGYLILLGTWILFMVSINSLLELWKYPIAPLAAHLTTIELHARLYRYFTTCDTYVIRSWAIYIVLWWWAIISWCGLKLFKHSKSKGH